MDGAPVDDAAMGRGCAVTSSTVSSDEKSTRGRIVMSRSTRIHARLLDPPIT